MKATISAIVILALTGCVTTTSHYGKRPDFMSIQVGMTQDQVIQAIGRPSKVAAIDGQTYLQYGWDDPWDGKIGAAEEFFVRIVDGKVDAFGEKGDFDSTKDPTININKRIKIE